MTKKKMTIRDILNDIKWNEKHDEGDFGLKFIHRGHPKNYKEIEFTEIMDVLGAFFTIKGTEPHEELINIPFHRILEIKNKRTNEIIYEKNS